MKTLNIALRTFSGDVPVGTVVENPQGETFFEFDPSYVDRGPSRPLLSLLWHSTKSEDETLSRIRRRADKIGRRGFLPPWFSGLLPEGALRQLVERELGPGRHGEFLVLSRLGADLPGAVVASHPQAEPATRQAPARIEGDGRIHFSLAGVQMKFAADLVKDRVTFPAEGKGGSYIAKTTSETWRPMVEAEHMAMSLARALGIDTVDFFLAPIERVEGVPEEFLRYGDHIFVSRRFDRASPGRVHMEDFAQIAEATGDRKYTAGTYETCINIINRFSVQREIDLEQGFRRMINDVLVGNGDAHLKNWSFLHSEGGPRLSKAYDIVPTAAWGDNRLALRLVGHYAMDKVSLARLLRIADFVRFPRDTVSRLTKEMVEGALDTWGTVTSETQTADDIKRLLMKRLDTLQIVQDVRPSALVQGYGDHSDGNAPAHTPDQSALAVESDEGRLLSGEVADDQNPSGFRR